MTWTIEQETTLFRAICRFKPAGVHKHFRMLSIHKFVNGSGAGPKLSISQIWDKLGELYNLPGLDSLEDNTGSDGSDSGPESDAGSAQSPVFTGSTVSGLSSSYYQSKRASGLTPDDNFDYVEKYEPIDPLAVSEFVLPWDDYGELVLSHAEAVTTTSTADPPSSPAGAVADSDGDGTLTPPASGRRKTRGQSRSVKRGAAEAEVLEESEARQEAKRHSSAGVKDEADEEPADQNGTEPDKQDDSEAPDDEHDDAASTPAKRSHKKKATPSRSSGPPVRRSSRRK